MDDEHQEHFVGAAQPAMFQDLQEQVVRQGGQDGGVGHRHSLETVQNVRQAARPQVFLVS